MVRKIQRLVLEQARKANVGHIGSALSVVHILDALYNRVLDIDSPDDPGRDRFILSKGHAALALYVVLYLRGWIDRKSLDSYCSDGSLLGVHPTHQLPGVDFSTGSLGQGLSIGAGAALAARMLGESYRVFVLISDAECNEGSVWEAAMFAAHHRLSNLVVIIDSNGQQALGYTRNVLDLEPMTRRWEAFGWHSVQVDGHDTRALVRALEEYRSSPLALVARTTFGKGVSYMENAIKWHYWPMSQQQYEQALREIDGKGD